MSEDSRTSERRPFDASLPGWPQWIRVPWLRGIYFPFWNTVNAVRRGWIAARWKANLVTDDELYALTSTLDEHPEGWEHPCMCATCRSYADG